MRAEVGLLPERDVRQAVVVEIAARARDPVVEHPLRAARRCGAEEMLERVGDVLLRRRFVGDKRGEQRGEREPEEETARHFSTW